MWYSGLERLATIICEGFMKLINSAFVIAASLVVFSFQVFAQSPYRVVAIPKPPGDFYECAIYGISNEGSVLGACDADGPDSPFIWKNGTFTYLRDIVGPLAESPNLIIRSINSAGVVSFATGSTVAVIENGVVRIVGSVPYSFDGGDTQVNDNGDIIYVLPAPANGAETPIYVFRNGTQTYFAPDVAVGELGQLQGFNNNGVAVFSSTGGAGSKYPYRSYVFDSFSGSVRELPRKGKGIRVANINDSGIIIGEFFDIKYAHLPFKISNVRVVQLPSAARYNTDFYAKTWYSVGGINNSGVISGAAFDRIAKGRKILYPSLGVFMWSNTGIANLQSQFAPFAGKANIIPMGDVSDCGAAAFRFASLTSPRAPNPIGAIAIHSSCNF